MIWMLLFIPGFIKFHTLKYTVYASKRMYFTVELSRPTRISISPKNQFLKETMETNVSGSLSQPHKASTEKPARLRSTLLASRGGSEGAAPALIEVGGCIHSCTFSKFLRVNMHLWSEGCLGALLCPECVGFCWEMYTGKINGRGIRGKCAQHCPALQPTTQLGSSWSASATSSRLFSSSTTYYFWFIISFGCGLFLKCLISRCRDCYRFVLPFNTSFNCRY